MVERVIRTLKDRCVHRHLFESLQHAIRVFGDWIGFIQPPAPSPGAEDENPSRSLCLSSLTCAVSAGSIHPVVSDHAVTAEVRGLGVMIKYCSAGSVRDLFQFTHHLQCRIDDQLLVEFGLNPRPSGSAHGLALPFRKLQHLLQCLLQEFGAAGLAQ